MELYGKDIQKLYQNTERSRGGFYPVGVNNLWHSGIHIHTDYPINPVMEGNLVAYRIADDYCLVDKRTSIAKEIFEAIAKADQDCYEDFDKDSALNANGAKKLKNGLSDEQKKDKFSSGFVLIRHQAQVPLKDDKGEPLLDADSKVKKQAIDFFSLYVNLKPDKAFDIVNQYSDFNPVKPCKEQVPFYRQWQFQFNSSKANTYYTYNKHQDIFEFSTGVITDDRIIHENNPGNLNCRFNNENQTVAEIDTVYLAINDESFTVKAKTANINFYPPDATDFSNPQGTLIVDKELHTSTKSKRNFQWTRCLMVSGTSAALKLNTKTGWFLDSQLHYIDSNYYKAKNPNTPLPIYKVEPVTKEALGKEDINDYYMTCTYKDLSLALGTMKANAAHGIINNLVANYTQRYKEGCVNEVKVIIADDGTSKPKYANATPVVLCNLKHGWTQHNQDWWGSKGYSVGNSDINGTILTGYLSYETFAILRKLLTTPQLKTPKFQLYTTEETNQYVYDPEHVKVSESINLAGPGKIFKATSYIPVSSDSQWLVKAEDLTLSAGPTFRMKAKGESPGSDNKYQGSAKGLMVYDAPGFGNARKVLTGNETFSLANPENYFNDFKPNEFYAIILDGNPRYITCGKNGSIDYLKAKSVVQDRFTVGNKVQLPKEDIYVTTTQCLGYSNQRNFCYTDQTGYHDLIVFFKDSAFMKAKPQGQNNQYLIPASQEIKQLTTQSAALEQRFPAGTVFSISEKTTMTRATVYKVKIKYLPLYFRKGETTDVGKGFFNIVDKLTHIWLIDCQIDKDKLTFLGTAINAKNGKVAIDMLQHNLSGLAGQKKCQFIDTSGQTFKLLADVSTISPDLWIEKLGDMALDEAQQTLSVNSQKLVELFTQEPYAIEDTTLVKAVTQRTDLILNSAGSAIPIDGKDYLAFTCSGLEFYTPLDSVQKKNLLDWKQFFQILDKADDDLFCDIKSELVDRLPSDVDEAEKKGLLDTLVDANKFKAALNNNTNPVVVQALHKMVVSHPLEWNKDLYSNLKPVLGHSTEQDIKYMQDTMKSLGMWSDIQNIKGIDGKKDLTFAHPLYFLNHLDKLIDHDDPQAFLAVAKLGMEITGRQGSLLILNGGKGKLLCNVSYLRQEDNNSQYLPARYNGSVERKLGYSMCQLTSLAMVMAWQGIAQTHPGKKYPDELYEVVKPNYEAYVNEPNHYKELNDKSHAKWVEDNLWWETSLVYDLVLSKYDKSKWYSADISGSKIKEKIDQGVPVILGLGYGDNNSGGHVVVVIGYTPKGYIIHDPYGNLNKYGPDWANTDGRYVVYDYGTHLMGERYQYCINKN